MNIRELNHYNIRVPRAQLTAVRDFYTRALGLHDGERFVGHWLYAGQRPVLHLMIEEEGGAGVPSAGGTTGCIDHVAFLCAGLADSRARLDALGVAYVVNDVPFMDLVQLVVHDPIGIKIELQFLGEGGAQSSHQG